MIDQNLLAYLETFITPVRIDRFKAVLAERTNYITVAIEDVFQRHNTSAVLRSCDVFGIQNVHVIEAKFEQDIDKNIAMGAEKWVDIEQYSTAKSCIEHLRGQGYKIVATTPHAESCLLENFEITDKTALFFGTEKDGLSEVVLKEADAKLKIPMSGFSESLNISVSAAIILYDLIQKLKRSDVSWQLTDTEILEKRLDWTKKTIKSIEEIMERYVNEH